MGSTPAAGNQFDRFTVTDMDAVHLYICTGGIMFALFVLAGSISRAADRHSRIVAVTGFKLRKTLMSELSDIKDQLASGLAALAVAISDIADDLAAGADVSANVGPLRDVAAGLADQVARLKSMDPTPSE